ncbi:nuclear transport factor 2 family protein [Nocardia cyriacigeorgica]|uniref:SnoaL-like domain-containing protein n=3 Tax=Nocardia TaxID=1817 RepID=H6R511_NOCCG|nr:nuclear transport factor 2 family protein [Nocardia cyriacigeorgica]BDT89530.1 hypothetical protein FMUAM8_52940 [Nocardia cyriacigeorgica]CCF65835.1 protein of unknown function [Nocardia cyriacigeorgica GUH-2]
MPSTINMTAIHAVYDAFSTGDLDRFIDLLDPDFASRQSDAVPWRGTYHGRAGVRDMFSRVARSGSASFHPEEFIDGGDRVVVIGRAHITPHNTDRGFDVRELHVWRAQDGRLLSLDVFLNAPAPMLAALTTT